MYEENKISVKNIFELIGGSFIPLPDSVTY